jgi:hypothetical protein
MIGTNELKAELAQLQKRRSLLTQQRDAVGAQLHGVIGAISNVESLIKRSEAYDNPTVESPAVPPEPPSITQGDTGAPSAEQQG